MCCPRPLAQQYHSVLSIDLRFTRCTRAALFKQLGPLSFSSSHKKGLFYPAPLSISLHALESIAAASTPTVALYSSPLQSTFRIHIDKLFHHSRDTCADAPQSHPHIDNSTLLHPVKQSPRVSPFYQNAAFTRPPLAQHDFAPDGDPDPLAVVRPPPSWNTLQSEKPCTTTSKQRTDFESPKDLPQFAHRRFNKRTSGAVNDMVNMLANKRQRRQVASAPPRAVSGMSTTSRNPFTKRVVSVFSNTEPALDDVSNPPLQHEDPTGPSSATVDDLPNKVRRIRVSKPEPDGKLLKPITSLKAPVLPKEYLPCPPQVVKPKASMKQTRLSFPPTCPPARKL